MTRIRLILAIIGTLALVSVIPAAEPAAGNGTNDVAVLLDDGSLWRHYHLAGPSTLLTATGTVVKARLATDQEGKTTPFEWPAAFTSPLPSADWAKPAYDDSAWPRLFWPQPTIPDSAILAGRLDGTGGGIRGWNPYDTVVMLARNKFEVKDPAQVKSCRLSLDYWGGVVVYVNGKEAVRGHLPDKQASLMDLVAEVDSDDRYRQLRQLREVEIPVALLRPGLNVLAVEAHAAQLDKKGLRSGLIYASPPIGLLNARLTVSPASAATNREPRGVIRLWNSETYDTVTVFDRAEPATPVRPVTIRAARNSVFSGRLMVGSDQPIKGLKVTVGDLALAAAWVPYAPATETFAGGPAVGHAAATSAAQAGATPAVSGVGAGIPSSAVRVRYAAPAEAGKSWLPAHRFDGLFDTIPAIIPVSEAPPAQEDFYTVRCSRPGQVPGAVAPLWFTVRVPKDTRAGVYEGKITVSAEGLAPTNVPLQVRVCAWTLPDPRDCRIQNFLYHAEEAEAMYYGVTNYSARHLELVGKSLALMAELNSFQVQANLTIDFFEPGSGGRSNPESLVRWIKKADGSYIHDFTVFDRYLAMVAKAIGKPRTLRLNCWGETGIGGFSGVNPGGLSGRKPVSVLDPATGKLTSLQQPPLGTKESLEFWKPVFREALKKLKERGWLDETTIGYNIWCGAPFPQMVDVAHELWPDGEWSFTAHNGTEDMKFGGTGTNVVMTVRHADGVNYGGVSGKRTPLWLLDAPRRNSYCWTARQIQNDYSPLREIRRLVELYALMPGYDGLSEIGADLFPLKRPVGGYYAPSAGAGTGWCLGRSIISLLYPGPDGPLATERFEMFREGTELCEAVLFVRSAVYKQQISGVSGELHRRAERYVAPQDGEREQALNHGWFGPRYRQSEEDAKLLTLAGEVVESRLLAGAGKAYGLKAAGGNHTNLLDGFWVHKFMNVGATQFTPSEDITVEYLVVGGGGGGGTAASNCGTGGGGAGGLLTSVSGCYSGGGTPGVGSAPSKPVPLKAGTAYTLIVGDGGAAGSTGQDSIFGNPGAEFARAKGGGAGGNSRGAGQPGGSGGGGGAYADAAGAGAAGTGTANQGFAGGAGDSGDIGAGGGGAGGVGLPLAGALHGGPGLSNTITGTGVVYAGGGGGGDGSHGGHGAGGSAGGGRAGGAGTSGTGGGGGGLGPGGQGGSGIVIIRYKAAARSAP